MNVLISPEYKGYIQEYKEYTRLLKGTGFLLIEILNDANVSVYTQ